MQVAGVGFIGQQVERVAHMQSLTTLGVLRHHAERVIVAHFAHAGGAGVLIQQRPQPLQKQQIFRLGFVVLVELIAVGVIRANAQEALDNFLARRVVF